jgi:hypothetical protein
MRRGWRNDPFGPSIKEHYNKYKYNENEVPNDNSIPF